jgi:hypothetical protein
MGGVGGVGGVGIEDGPGELEVLLGETDERGGALVEQTKRVEQSREVGYGCCVDQRCIILLTASVVCLIVRRTRQSSTR